MRFLKLMAIAGIASLSAVTYANDFPTFDRVGFAMTCMDSNGGPSLEAMFACSCRLDHIAAKMSYDEYQKAETYLRYQRMPGEKGGIFRDIEDVRPTIANFKKIRDEASAACPMPKILKGSRE
ncbi:MAG: hypothetical protein WD572_00385 [Gammaproteobacteria bacterium]